MTHPHSVQRLMGFDLLELPNDINGKLDGPLYEPFLQLSDMHAHRNVRSGRPGVWSGRPHMLASKDEYYIFMVLEGNPRIISIREGYELYSADVIADILMNRPVERNRVISIDFVVTLAPFNVGGPLRYKGLSSKPPNQAGTPSGMRRAEKEAAWLAQLGWDWSYVKVPPRQSVLNHMKLRSWAKAASIDDGASSAGALSGLMYRTASTKTLARQLSMFGKRLGIKPEDQFFVFACAYYLGFLALDHSQKLDEASAPALAPPFRRPRW